METLKSILESKVRAAVNGLADESVSVIVSQATDARFGDYQTNIAMALAKPLRANPRQIAGQIIERLLAEGIDSICDKPEIAGAGFINFRIKPEFLRERFVSLFKDEALGIPKVAKAKRIVIDFSAPNIAKPMHVGHIRSTILGDTLARIARFLGNDVVTDNHIGDWGTQFGKVIYGWKNLLNEEALSASPVHELVRLYKESNALAENEPEIMTACRLELVKLQQGDPENVGIWKKCVELSRHEFEDVYKLLDIHFDEWLGESCYNDRLGPLVEKLLASGLAEISDGAACVFFREHPALAGKPCLIRKRDGGFLYATTDLATIEYRVERWNPDAIWYVVGAPQQLHLSEVFEVARRMGIDSELRHIAFGSILGEDRKLMKTRSGDNVALRDLLDEAQERARKIIEEKNPDLSPEEKSEIARVIGLGAVKYAELSQFRMTDYVFAWDKMLSFQGNTAPYLQNAYVRIRSIFRKGGLAENGFALSGDKVALSEEAEFALVKKLSQFGEILPQVLEDFRPNILANYLYELAITFHGFYEACPVLKSEGEVREARLALCDLTARALKQGLSLLGIQVPERM
jgi:arginyl-tRNA synthetase